MLTVPAMASRRHTAKMDTLASQTDVLNATRPSQFNKEEFSSPKKQPASQVCAGSKKAHTETDKVPENQNEPDKRKFLSSEKGQASAVGELEWQEMHELLCIWFGYPLSTVLI